MKFAIPSILFLTSIAVVANQPKAVIVGLPPLVHGRPGDTAFARRCASAFFERAKVARTFDERVSLIDDEGFRDSLARCKDSLACEAILSYGHGATVALFTRLDRKGQSIQVRFSWLNVNEASYPGGSEFSGSNLKDLEARLPSVVEQAVVKAAGIWPHFLNPPSKGSEFPPSVVVPTSTFARRTFARRSDTATRIRTFTITSFKAATTEVTWGQYLACTEAGACAPARYEDGSCTMIWPNGAWLPGKLPPPSSRDVPVTCVDWIDARDYCAWVGGELPTQMQWESIARSGDTAAYPWRTPDEACRKENLRDLDFLKDKPDGWEAAFQCHDGYTGLAPVGRFAKNAWGLSDVIGNAREWVDATWDPCFLADADSLDPIDRTSRVNKLMIHMGSSYSSPRRGDCYYEARAGAWPGTAMESTGFRCVQNLPR